MRKVDPERREAKRRQILEAAMGCFARRGFHATTTAEICAAAGMSPGNLFHYFPTKDAIVAAIAEEDRRETAALFAAFAEAEDAVEAVQDVAEAALAQFADEAYARLSLEIAAEAMRNPAVAAPFAANDAEAKAALVALLGRGVERGQIDPGLDLDRAAAWLIALLDGAIGRAVMDPSFDAEGHAPTLRLLIARFLRPQG